MVDGFVIDANILVDYVAEWALDDGETYKILSIIENCFGFAYSDIIYHEWKNRSRKLIFDTWFEEGVKGNRIRKEKIHV